MGGRLQRLVKAIRPQVPFSNSLQSISTKERQHLKAASPLLTADGAWI
jgi:hypothetical protein